MSASSIPSHWIEAVRVLYLGTLGGAMALAFCHWQRSHRIPRPIIAGLVCGFGVPLVTWVVTLAFPIAAATLARSTASLFGTLALAWVIHGLSRTVLEWLAHDELFRSTTDAVIVTDDASHVIDVNPAARKILRAAHGQLSNRTLGEVAEACKIDLTGQEAHTEVVAVARDGEHVRWYELTKRPIPNVFGGNRGRLVLLRDVTERQIRERDLEAARSQLESKIAERTVALCQEIEQRKHTEAALAQSEHRFRAVFDQAFQLVGVTDPAGTLLDANRSALAFVNAELRDVVGRHFAETLWWKHAPEEARRLRTALTAAAQGVFVRYEATLTANDGSARVLDFSLKPVKDDQGNVIFIIPEGRDITDLKRSEQERQSLAAQLHQSQRLEALGRLAGGVAHDFNNLLTVITGNLSLLDGSQVLDASSAFDIQGTLDATRRAGELTRRLMAFSRRQIAEPRVFRPAESLNGLRKILPRVVGDHISVQVTVTGDPGAVFMDPAQFEQIVMNLVVNARDAMPTGGQLDATLSRIEIDDPKHLVPGLVHTGTYVALTISDTGSGIPDSIIHHLFEPFFTTKSPGAGTGLGLATVHGIVTQAMGAITVDSKMGWGTTFRVLLPSCEGSPIADREHAVAVARSPLGTVMVVEDQDSVRELVVRVLKSHRFEVVAHADGSAALECARNVAQRIDLVLTDVVMPEMGGRALADAMRRLRPSVPFVFMSGHADDAILRQGIEQSREFFLAKPFTPQTLVEKLSSILALSRPA